MTRSAASAASVEKRSGAIEASKTCEKLEKAACFYNALATNARYAAFVFKSAAGMSRHANKQILSCQQKSLV
jgi:hypothetical protein